MDITISTNLNINESDFYALEQALSKELPVIVNKVCGDKTEEFLKVFQEYNQCLLYAGIETETTNVVIDKR